MKILFKHIILVVAYLLLTFFSSYAQNGIDLFDNTRVHEIRLTFESESFWDSLQNRYEIFNEFSGTDIPYLLASVEIDGNLLDSIGVRLKGKSSYFYVDRKKPFKLDFNEFVKGQKFDGLKKINLHNGIGDPAMVRNLLGYNLMRANGIMAPRVAYCRLYLNNEFWGLYEIVEQVDQTFLNNNFASGKGNLFKNQRWSNLEWFGPSPSTYKDTFELKTNKAEDDWTGFINFLDVLNNTSDEVFVSEIEAIFDVDQYLHVLAIDVMTNNWDSYIDNRRNWYLYEEPKSGKFHWIPWDYNLSLGGRLVTEGNPFPPFNEECLLKTTFSFSRTGSEFKFTEFSEPPAENWLWNFGDGTTSTQQNPSHVFENTSGQNYVCLTSKRLENGSTCEQTRCIPIDLSKDPNDCPTVQDGAVPYDSSDPIFQEVIAQDDYCCSDEWDVFCEIKYAEIQQNGPINSIETGNDYDTDYSLLQNNPEKILIHRLMEVPKFQERYLDICCIIRDQYFNEDLLFPQIDYFSDLIREDIQKDPNYIYTWDYFEYDVGNGTGGGEEANIPSLKLMLQLRFEDIDTDLANTNHDCSTAFTSLNWNDVVINEIVATNTESSGVKDADGEFDDWIELYNNTSLPIDLFGYYLKDNILSPFRWYFPEGTVIAPNDYLIVWADKDLMQQDLHASFKLSSEGEEVLLAHEDGTWIDHVAFSEQEDNSAFARIPNGTGLFQNKSMTFNQNNETSTSIHQTEINSHLTIYPNPNNGDYLYLKFAPKPSGNKFRLIISNSLGQKILQKEILIEELINLDLALLDLRSGIYLFEIQLEDDASFSKRILIY